MSERSLIVVSFFICDSYCLRSIHSWNFLIFYRLIMEAQGLYFSLILIILLSIQFIVMQAVTVSIENQKRALQLKYLLHLPTQQNQSELLHVLNKLYPFSQYPLNVVPPIELIETKQAIFEKEEVNETTNKKVKKKLTEKEMQEQQKIIAQNLGQEIQKYSYLILTGGLVIQKRQHRFVENRYVGPGIEEEVFFNINEGKVCLAQLPSSCYIRIHNIWIEKAKKKYKTDMEEYVKKKLMEISFFANLTFPQFQKCFKSASVQTLGPGDVLLKTGATPYHLYIVSEGELVFERKVKFLNDPILWLDVKNELQRQEDNTCEEMFKYLVKEPRSNEQTFEIIFKLRNISENEIICAKQTLCEEALTYSIVSSLKTKLICIKYPDLYNLNADRLSEIRNWETFDRKDLELRKDFYYQMKWSEFKEETKRESHLNKMEKQKFEDFLRKEVNLSQEKNYYFPNKVGEGSIIDNPAGKVSKLKSMSYVAN